MWDRSRPAGRFFCVCILSASALVGQGLEMRAWAGTPSMTTVSDIVYRADGTTASGSVIISWPPFVTADGIAVAAGTKAVRLGSDGTILVQLAPNAGATPTTYYSAIYQLSDNTVRTEFWSIPTASPATIAMIRATPGASNSASQMATRQYVDSAVAGRASDGSVVHITGAETISGAKQFSVGPTVPTPVSPGDAVNKAYVDSVIVNTGGGDYLSKDGDAMAGPLTLVGDPTAPLQAATRQYVDHTAASKADLLLGLVPPAELGQGAANASLCLKGDSSWGACGTSSNAALIQSIPVDPTAPSDGQVITYVAASGSYKPKAGAATISSVFGRTGTITAQTGDYSAGQITGAEVKSNKGAANGYAGLDASAKVPANQLPNLAESQITNLISDLGSKLGNNGAQTLSGDLTASGKLVATTLQTSGTGPWTVEGSFGTITVAGANNSKLGLAPAENYRYQRMRDQSRRSQRRARDSSPTPSSIRIIP
jgi:hypothetical protein